MASHRRLIAPIPIKRSPQRRAPLKTDPAPPAWPSFVAASEYVGTSASGRVSVFVDPALGGPGLQNAQDLVADADRIVAQNDLFFATSEGTVSVIVFALGGATDGTGGADHMGCDYVTGYAIEVCASFGDSQRVSALFEAELSECAMGNNLCGQSTGEALSRWCASAVSGNALSDFATAPTWVSDGMANFVDSTDPTDQNADSTGCAVAFLSWLMSQGYALSDVAQSMVKLGDGATLAELYYLLTGDAQSSAWLKFSAAVQALPYGVTTDDPFGAAAPGPQPPPVPPSPGPGPAPVVTLSLEEVVTLLAKSWPAN